MNRPQNMTNDPTVLYDENYYETGLIKGISGYVNYSWMPELTLKMAHHLICELKIGPTDTLLDFGCAKGFLVKAMRILGVDAYGVDVSNYAISQCPTDVVKFCQQISCDDKDAGFTRHYNWMLSKDVFEHIEEDQLRKIMTAAHKFVDHMFLVIPLGKDDTSGQFVIAEYDKDITHVTAKTAQWWQKLFEETGWTLEFMTHSFKGIKENWTQAHPLGNIFVKLNSDSSVK